METGNRSVGLSVFFLTTQTLRLVYWPGRGVVVIDVSLSVVSGCAGRCCKLWSLYNVLFKVLEVLYILYFFV